MNVVALFLPNASCIIEDRYPFFIEINGAGHSAHLVPATTTHRKNVVFLSIDETLKIPKRYGNEGGEELKKSR